jgi:phage terminase small subunit
VSNAIVVRLACEQVDELVSLRRATSQIRDPRLRLKYLRAVQESERTLLQTVSALGFTPTARAKLGLVVAQAAETQTRLERFTGRNPG